MSNIIQFKPLEHRKVIPLGKSLPLEALLHSSLIAIKSLSSYNPSRGKELSIDRNDASSCENPFHKLDESFWNSLELIEGMLESTIHCTFGDAK